MSRISRTYAVGQKQDLTGFKILYLQLSTNYGSSIFLGSERFKTCQNYVTSNKDKVAGGYWHFQKSNEQVKMPVICTEHEIYNNFPKIRKLCTP
jgi:hypothetical protein